MDLIDYLANSNGEFNASLGETGGYITFSNSGRRGNVKCFQISLDSLKKTIEDILNNLHVFENIQDYVEKNWRDNGSVYFTDEVANAMITVQTKPLFSTLSKLIKWGNEPILNSVDDTQKIIISQEALKNTLAKLADTILQYSPQKTKRSVPFNPPLQQIFYGAPGTGKSHKVKEVTETLPKSDVFRTTFHPDSDYSTFVGCYKPKMVKAPIRDGSGHEITSACEDEKKRIAYEYEPQAFLKAYVRAYETNDPVFLVIEEINRGNCAQIFGDMFQLLDRNEAGESDYAIKPETAIQEFLNEKLKDCDIADEVIKSGEEMRLPANLHIWATMNTSDQSLFPIDSAFKRRWDWKYMPIDTRKESWGIKVNGTEYSWSRFLEKINEEIGSITNSEDKKLGFYFCKAENGIISAEKFVSKVLFYIYNDVFKDYGFESSKNKDLFKDGDNKLAFGTFYSDNGSIREEKVDLFLKNLGVEDAKRNNMISNDEEDEDGNSSTTESSSRNYDKFSINGSGRYAKNNLAAECVKKYIELNSDITVEEVLHNWSDFKNLVPHFMESKDEFDARTDNSKRSHEIPCNGSVLYVAHNGYGSNGKAQILMDSVNQKGWGLTIERHNA